MERDDETSQYYDHARYEGFTIGRFLSLDPISGGPRNPQGWNRYSYTLGNPISAIDPYGLLPCTTTWAPEGPTVTCPKPWDEIPDATPDWGIIRLPSDLTQRVSRIWEQALQMYRDASEAEPQLPPFLSNCRDSLFDRALDNFEKVNDEIPGLFMPMIANFVTTQTVAQEYGLVTLRQYALGGFRGLVIQGVEHSSLSTLATAGASSFINMVLVGGAFETGLAIGSVLNAGLIAPCVE
jgi:RHS repeat-associated protein